jgi:Tol biopolymer transport system component
VRSHAPEGLRQSDLFVVRPDGSGLRQLTTIGGELRGPTWSPDGSRLVYFAVDGDLHSISVSGDNDVRLTSDAGDDRDPDWSHAAG